MDVSYYFEQLYPLQDEVLRVINSVETGLYLTGGTASSRAYLEHRFSDDLDLFANHDKRFVIWADEVSAAIRQASEWSVEVSQIEERFVRLFVHQRETTVKVEMVNDVQSHIGPIRIHPILGRLDSPENILANKVTAALDRQEPKDLADIWGFCTHMGLSLETAITDAQSKAAGVFPPDLARVLLSATEDDWRLVRWWKGPSVEQFLDDLRVLGERLILLP